MAAGADVLVVFPSALGWMALQGGGSTLKQLVFGHKSPAAALHDLDPAIARSASVGSWNPRLVKRLQAYAEGARDQFLDVEIDLGPQTDFQRAVVENCRNIGYGQVMTYGELAKAAGRPRAARAVGNIMRNMRISLVVPCHRVVGSAKARGSDCPGEERRGKLRRLEEQGAKPRSRGQAPESGPGRPPRLGRKSVRKASPRRR